jgi:hypothetical protein
MAKFSISYARFKIDAKGKKGGVTGTVKTVEAPSAEVAMSMIQSQHPGYTIEYRKVQEK